MNNSIPTYMYLYNQYIIINTYLQIVLPLAFLINIPNRYILLFQKSMKILNNNHCQIFANLFFLNL